MYSSFSKKAVLENLNRRLILKFISTNEGITFSALKEKIGLQNGVLAYHLAMLDKNRYIKSFTDGKFKRFYSRGARISGLTTTEEEIMAVIQSDPFISKKMILSRIKYSQGTVNINIKKLMQKQLICARKDGKRFIYYPKSLD